MNIAIRAFSTILNIVAVVLFLFAPSNVFAAPIMNGLAPGLAAPGVTINFDTLSGGIILDDQLLALGVDFNAAFQTQANTNVGNVSGTVLNAPFALGSSSTSIYGISFLAPVSQAGFFLRTNFGTTTFTALLGGSVVETFSAGSDASRLDNFYGFENVVFDELRYQISATNSHFNLDNLQFTTAPVPEPATLLLVSFGGLASLVRSRRKRHLQ